MDLHFQSADRSRKESLRCEIRLGFYGVPSGKIHSQLFRKKCGGKTDEEIIAFLSLKRKVPWKQDLDYLSTKYGFVTSRKINKFDSEISLTEKEQLDAIENKDKW